MAKNLLSGIDVKELFGNNGDLQEKTGQVVKVRLIDRIKVIEMVGNHVKVQAFNCNQKVEVVDRAAAITMARRRVLELSR